MIVRPNDVTEAKTKAEKKIESALAGAFRDIVEGIPESFYEAYETETEAARVADLVSFDAFDDVPEEITGSLESVYLDSGSAQLDDLEITEEAIFDLVHEDAAQYAADRAAELVGKRILADGSLVDNPNAEWAITETTRDSLRALIERSYTDGLSPANLAKEIKSSYGFSKDRSKLIAKTETSKASMQGSLDGWKRSGVVEGKESLLSDDHDQDDECNEAADDGVIPLDEDFSNGEDSPPYHPGCNCTMVASLSDESEDEDI